MSRVLVADDEKNIRSTLATTFRLEGYDVETVEDGAAAVEAVERGGIDLLVLDLQMPGTDGMQARAIKNTPDTKTSPTTYIRLEAPGRSLGNVIGGSPLPEHGRAKPFHPILQGLQLFIEVR